MSFMRIRPLTTGQEMTAKNMKRNVEERFGGERLLCVRNPSSGEEQKGIRGFVLHVLVMVGRKSSSRK